jgi:uncharacterized protein (TIGR02186 family)
VRRYAQILALAGLFAATDHAVAERLTVAMSTPEVRIDSNFTGVPITIFGVIERDAQTVSRGGEYEIAIMVLGPPESVVARRKDRILGVWANSDSETFLAAPSFYVVNATGALDDLAAAPLLKRFRLGFDNLGFRYDGRDAEDDPAAAQFRDAFLRIKQKAGLYSEEVGGVGFIGDTIFRTTVWIPANVPVGAYQVGVFLFADGAVLARADESFSIAKTGFEQFMFTFSREDSFIYGVVCVALALFTGWLAGVIFRRD